MFNDTFGFFSSRSFNDYFRAFPVAMMPSARDNLNYGGKVILPPSALAKLTFLNIDYPMLFELKLGDKSTHAGVLEFIAEEGRVYLPQWIMETLQCQPGDILTIKNTTLPLGQFVKIQPQSVDFLDISDPKAVLENAFRNFSTLTVGDVFVFKYNDKEYGIHVLETKPEGAGITIIETDLEVDFAPPVGYVEPQRQPRQTQPISTDTSEIENYARKQEKKFKAFVGEGTRLDGKFKVVEGIDDEDESGPPAFLDVPDNMLVFGFKYIPPKKEGDEEKEQKKDERFKGEGFSLRKLRRRNQIEAMDLD